jgi:peptidoglycan/xylan/chitin deacetylase (PgdA/CDA1 family)
MRTRIAVFAALIAVGAAGSAMADCSDPDAIGVERTLTVDTTGGLAAGSEQYKGSLGLADNEVVLTFDDGPYPGASERVLQALNAACTQATFFIVGEMAQHYPDVLRAEDAAGDTIGTHTWSHPVSLSYLPYDSAARQIDRGIAAVTGVLGHPPAPFFRFPGLGDTRALRARLAAANIGIFSTDVDGSDWTGISSDQIRRNVLRGLREHHGGIVLLHDIKKATARMLPQLLRDMKAAGYQVVHIAPARYVAGEVPATG